MAEILSDDNFLQAAYKVGFRRGDMPSVPLHKVIGPLFPGSELLLFCDTFPPVLLQGVPPQSVNN